MDVTNKRILVVGFGKSGLAASRLLLSKGACVWITEKEDNIELRKLAEDMIRDGARVELGRHSRKFIEGTELIVISPGVGHECEVVGWAREYEIPVISELELASWYIACPLVAVTGTNGKSTVTSLIEHIFRCSGRSVVACGNIGVPLSEVALQKNILDLAIVEVSSFQLEYINSFRPDVAVWLNFSFDHLDRHQSMEEYLEAKLNIFKNQGPGDWAVIYSKELNHVKKKVRAKVVVYGKEMSEYYCPGVFQENVSAAVALTKIYGVGPEDIKSTIDTFKPLPHRLEHVATINGVKFIDDSKATNIDSVLGALDSVEGQVILILGGRDKGDDFGKLKETILKKASSVVAIGEARDKICSQLNNTVHIEKRPNLGDAVRCAFRIAAPGRTVLFSPGCSSFDMFRDYKQRGEAFQECVDRLGAKEEVCLAKE